MKLRQMMVAATLGATVLTAVPAVTASYTAYACEDNQTSCDHEEEDPWPDDNPGGLPGGDPGDGGWGGGGDGGGTGGSWGDIDMFNGVVGQPVDGTLPRVVVDGTATRPPTPMDPAMPPMSWAGTAARRPRARARSRPAPRPRCRPTATATPTPCPYGSTGPSSTRFPTRSAPTSRPTRPRCCPPRSVRSSTPRSSSRTPSTSPPTGSVLGPVRRVPDLHVLRHLHELAGLHHHRVRGRGAAHREGHQPVVLTAPRPSAGGTTGRPRRTAAGRGGDPPAERDEATAALAELSDAAGRHLDNPDLFHRARFRTAVHTRHLARTPGGPVTARIAAVAERRPRPGCWPPPPPARRSRNGPTADPASPRTP